MVTQSLEGFKSMQEEQKHPPLDPEQKKMERNNWGHPDLRKTDSMSTLEVLGKVNETLIHVLPTALI